MATFSRFDPFRDMMGLQESLVRAFDTAYGRKQSDTQADVGAAWAPLVDIHEDQDGISLFVELPGVEQKDIDVHIENNTLTLRGERKLDRADAREGYHVIERIHGTFSRSFTLPPTVDAEHVSAENRDGVLRVRLPKRAESKPRQIKVQVDSARIDKAPAQKQ